MRRAISLLLPLLFMAATGTAQASPSLVCAHMTLDGPLTTTAEDFQAWLRPLEGSEDTQLAGFRLGADRLQVKEYEYAMAARASSAGVTLVDSRPAESNQTYAHDDAAVRLVRGHTDAQIRVVDHDGPGSIRFSFEDSYQLYANLSQADGWEDALAVQYATGTHPELEPFFRVPDDRLILTGEAGSLTGNGSLGLWLHGFDIQVMHADGSTTYAGHPARHGADQGPFEAEAESWRDYLFYADGAVDLEIVWTGASDVFAPAMHVLGDGRVLASEAHGLLPGPDGTEEYVGADAVFERPVDLTVHQAAAASGDRIALDVPASWASSAAPAAASGPFGAAGWLALAGLVVAFVGAGAAVPFVRRLRDRPPPTPARPVDAPTAPGGPAAVGRRIGRLLDDGDGGQAVPLLQKEVRRRPKSAELRYALGVAYGQAGATGRALVHLDYALRRDHAFLGMLLTDPRTRSFRHAPDVARMVRRAGRRFHNEAYRGYA